MFMNKIFWSTKILNEKHSVLILAPTESGLCFCLSDDGVCVYKSFDSHQEVLHYVHELNKPKYSSLFGTHYELVELPNHSEEWFDLIDVWKKTVEIKKVVTEYEKMSWWKRVIKAVKDLIIKPDPLL